MYYVALLGSILAAVGTLLPWSQMGTLFVNRGIDNPDGAIILGVSLAAAALAAYNLISKTNRLRLLLLLAAGGLIATGIMDLRLIRESLIEANSSFLGEVASVGSGIYMIIVGGVVLGWGAFLSLFQRKHSSDSQTDEEA